MCPRKYSKSLILKSKKLRNNMTDAENLLWLYLRKNQLSGVGFRRQRPMGSYIVDFISFEKKLIIEVDGGQHNGGEKRALDIKRDNFLRKKGYEVLRFWNNDIFNNLESVINQINEQINPPPKSEISTPPQGRGNQDCILSSSNNLLPHGGQSGGKGTLNDISLKESELSTQSNQPLFHKIENCLKIQCPAKINLTLKVVGKRDDGFHDIESIMQTISLYDYLTINIEQSYKYEIQLSGSSDEIPYDERNLVYKAAMLFVERTNILPHKINIHIEKNIPVEAGLAGGSTDAAGTLYGLNELFLNPLSKGELHELCARLGSDLNLCLEGGKQLTRGRGEILEPLEYEEFELSLIKPIGLGISAKEAYTKYSEKEKIGREKFVNDLEWAVIEDYPRLQKIKELHSDAIMSGSGPTYFLAGTTRLEPIEGYWVKNGLKSISTGVRII